MPKPKNTFSSWRRHLGQRAVHAAWAWAQRTGSVSAEHPGASVSARSAKHPPRLPARHGLRRAVDPPRLVLHRRRTGHPHRGPDARPRLGPDPILRIGDGVVLGRGSHVIADTTVTIGSDCYFGPYVYVTSTNHSYDDPHEPIGKQWPRMEPVEIGPGCWIGTGAVILPGARIGRNVVVAAGAVVRGTVPDHAVVAGAPARVVRRWTPETGWQPPLRTPAPGADPGGHDTGAAAGARGAGRRGRGEARRTGDGGLSRPPSRPAPVQPVASSSVPTTRSPPPPPGRPAGVR